MTKPLNLDLVRLYGTYFVMDICTDPEKRHIKYLKLWRVDDSEMDIVSTTAHANKCIAELIFIACEKFKELKDYHIVLRKNE